MTALYLLACLALVVTGFCRLVRTSTSTALPIRIVIHGLTVAAIAGIGAVLAGHHDARWPEVVMTWSMAAVQWVTGALWRDGVPLPFQRR